MDTQADTYLLAFSDHEGYRLHTRAHPKTIIGNLAEAILTRRPLRDCYAWGITAEQRSALVDVVGDFADNGFLTGIIPPETGAPPWTGELPLRFTTTKVPTQKQVSDSVHDHVETPETEPTAATPNLEHWLGILLRHKKPEYALVVCGPNDVLSRKAGRAIDLAARFATSSGAVAVIDNTSDDGIIMTPEAIEHLLTNKWCVGRDEKGGYVMTKTPRAIIVIAKEPSAFAGDRFMVLEY